MWYTRRSTNSGESRDGSTLGALRSPAAGSPSSTSTDTAWIATLVGPKMVQKSFLSWPNRPAIAWASLMNCRAVGRSFLRAAIIALVNCQRRPKTDPLATVENCPPGWSWFLGGGRGDAAKVAVLEPVAVVFQCDNVGVV